MSLPQYWNALRQGKPPAADGGPGGPRRYGSLADMIADRRRAATAAAGPEGDA